MYCLTLIQGCQFKEYSLAIPIFWSLFDTGYQQSSLVFLKRKFRADSDISKLFTIVYWVDFFCWKSLGLCINSPFSFLFDLTPFWNKWLFAECLYICAASWFPYAAVFIQEVSQQWLQPVKHFLVNGMTSWFCESGLHWWKAIKLCNSARHNLPADTSACRNATGADWHWCHIGCNPIHK